MYKIQASDQREYGPVNAQKIREWIVQRRVNRNTPVQIEGTTEWRPLSSFPEFDDTLAANAGAPSPPPPSESASAPPPQSGPSLTLLESAEKRSVDVMTCLTRAWELFCAAPWPILGVSLLVWVLLLVASSASIGLVLNGPLLAGLYWYLLRRIRGEEAILENAFAGFGPMFPQLLLASLVTCVFEALGLFLCILPGLYLILIWSFGFQLILDKKLQFWDAMELSRKTVHLHFTPMLGLFVTTFVLNAIGTLLCGVGLLVSVPVTTLAWLFAYEDLFRSADAQSA